MAQFDVHPNPNRKVAGDMPYVVDLQADFLRDLPTRILAPLVRPAAIRPSPHLNPIVTIDGEAFAVMTNHFVSLPTEMLAPTVATLSHHRDDLINALDFLFTGI